MSITGPDSGSFSYDSTSNGQGIITTDLDPGDVTFTNESIVVSGGSARLSGRDFNLVSTNVFASGFPLGNSSFVVGQRNSDATYSRSFLLFDEASSRFNIGIGNIEESTIVFDSSSSQEMFVYTNGNLQNVTFEGIKVHEVNDPWTIFFNVSYISTQIGMLNWREGRLDRFGINIPSTTSGYTSWLGGGNGGNNSFFDWNPINFDATAVAFGSANSKTHIGYTASWRFVDTSGNVDNVLVIYSDDRGGSTAEIGRYTTGNDGILEGTVDSQDESVVTSQDLPTLYILTEQSSITGGTTSTGLSDPSSVENYAMTSISFSIEVRSYLHEEVDSITSISEEIGQLNPDQTVNFFRDFLLTIDPGVTETNSTTVDGYSGISHSDGAFTLSGSLDLSEIYDSRKLYWRNNDNQTAPQKDGPIADLGDIDITFSGATSSPSSTDKFTSIATSGTITLGTNSSYDGITAKSSTVINVDACGATLDLSDSSNTFADGCSFEITDGGSTTITVASSALATQLDADKTETSGTVSFVGPQPTLTLTVAGPADFYVSLYDGSTHLNSSDTGLQTSPYTFIYTGSGSPTDVDLRVRRQGFRDFVTTIDLDAGNVDVNTTLEELLSPTGNPLYTGHTTSNFSVDLSGTPVLGRVGDGTVTVQQVFDMLEDSKVTVSGMGLDSFQSQKVVIDGFISALFLPSTVQFIRDSAGDSNATLNGYFVQADDQLIDNSNGDIAIVSALGLTRQQVRDAMALALSVGTSAAADSVDDKIDSILTDTETTIPNQIAALNNLAIADVETALGNYGASTFDGDLSGLSTHSAADVWSVATREITGLPDVTVGGYAAGQGPSDLIDLSNLDVAVSSRLSTAGYTAPANADISAIKAKTDQLTFTVANQVDANALTGGGGDDAATIYSYFTASNRQDTFKADVSGLSTFDGDLSGIPAAVWGYSAGDRLLSGSQATAIAQIGTINSNVSACLSAATAVADGRHVIDYLTSTATQYDADGSARTVFDLLDTDGNPATTAQSAVERRPQ